MKDIKKDSRLKTLFSKLEQKLINWELNQEFDTMDYQAYVNLGEYLINNYSIQELQSVGINGNIEKDYFNYLNLGCSAFQVLIPYFASFQDDKKVNKIYK